MSTSTTGLWYSSFSPWILDPTHIGKLRSGEENWERNQLRRLTAGASRWKDTSSEGMVARYEGLCLHFRSPPASSRCLLLQTYRDTARLRSSRHRSLSASHPRVKNSNEVADRDGKSRLPGAQWSHYGNDASSLWRLYLNIYFNSTRSFKLNQQVIRFQQLLFCLHTYIIFHSKPTETSVFLWSVPSTHTLHWSTAFNSSTAALIGIQEEQSHKASL